MKVQLDLEEMEAALLYRVIENRFGELRIELRHTKDSVSKVYLKHKERLLRRTLDKFPEELNTKAHWKGFRSEQ